MYGGKPKNGANEYDDERSPKNAQSRCFLDTPYYQINRTCNLKLVIMMTSLGISETDFKLNLNITLEIFEINSNSYSYSYLHIEHPSQIALQLSSLSIPDPDKTAYHIGHTMELSHGSRD